jgi:hypothetical protein
MLEGTGGLDLVLVQTIHAGNTLGVEIGFELSHHDRVVITRIGGRARGKQQGGAHQKLALHVSLLNA